MDSPINFDPQKIAFFPSPRMGDLITSLPLVYHFRSCFPNSEITLAVVQSNSSLLPFLRGYDRALVLPYKSFILSKKELKKLKKENRFTDLDLAISCTTSFYKEGNEVLTRLGAKHCLAVTKYKYFARLRSPNIDFPIFREREKKLHSLAVLNILFPEFTHVPEHLYPQLVLPPHLKPPQSKVFNELLNHNSSPLLFITPSYNRDFSFPGIDLYCEVLNRLYEHLPFRVAISSLKQDLVAAQIIHRRLKAPSCVVMSQNLGELLKLMELSELLFIGDGGLMHLGACLDKKQVVLFGRTLIEEWAPLTTKAINLFHPEHAQKIDKNEILNALFQSLMKT